ncbi:MAG: hypothetical protein AB8B52_10895 [Winogradskyella sp.]|uniref:hypothetical protein n=1 Tax=Winogradskyella sp. TaxID=1883156 RepID=UPI00385C8066
MKNIKIIMLALCIGLNGFLAAQTYVSPQQKTTTNGFTNRVETKLIKNISIADGKIIAELPEGGTFTADIELFKTIEGVNDENRTLYIIASGGMLSINDDLVDDNWDCIVLNLLSTPKKKHYTFWLTEGNKGDD